MLREDTDDLEQGIFVYFSSQQKSVGRLLGVGTRSGEGGPAAQAAPGWGEAKGNPGQPKSKLTPVTTSSYVSATRSKSLT